MKKALTSELKQCPYGFVGNERVDPTRADVQRAIDEKRFCESIMDRDYERISKEIQSKTNVPTEMNKLMRQFHAERVAELVRTKDQWLNELDKWPIKVNQFNHVIAGNHRFRAIRYLEIEEVWVEREDESQAHPMYGYPEIW
jgi:hypothetical protein